jgi:hypothetical protein
MTEEMMIAIQEELEKMTDEQAEILYDIRMAMNRDEEIDLLCCTDEEEKKLWEKYTKIAKDKMIKWGYTEGAIKEYFEQVWC